MRIPVTNTKSPTPSINKTTNYEYDDQLRLFRVTRGDGTQIIYSYDDAGNRIKNQVIVPQS
ncbi:RHS repeat protein [Candidatus Falkowbacteria bacterium]|nr:RHS repeat protein [Candidatus Falkowbacteria bacterium]